MTELDINFHVDSVSAVCIRHQQLIDLIVSVRTFIALYSSLPARNYHGLFKFNHTPLQAPLYLSYQ